MWDLIANIYHEEDGTGYALMFNTSDRYYLDVMYVCGAVIQFDLYFLFS